MGTLIRNLVRCKGTNLKNNQCKKKIFLSKNPSGYCNHHKKQDKNQNTGQNTGQNMLKSDKLNIINNLRKKREKRKKEKSEEAFCVICQDTIIEKKISLNCGHEYCLKCIQQIRSPVCPLCNSTIQDKDLGKSVVKSIKDRKKKDDNKRNEEETQNFLREEMMASLIQLMNGKTMLSLIELINGDLPPLEEDSYIIIPENIDLGNNINNRNEPMILDLSEDSNEYEDAINFCTVQYIAQFNILNKVNKEKIFITPTYMI